MSGLQTMPPVGLIVIVAIVALFALAVLLLFYVSARYKHLSSMVAGNLDKDNGFLRFVVNDFASAYKKYGLDVNTPALVQNAVSVKLSGLLLIERFLNNAVSLFVTLGLFGTFLGLSLSVSSLSELLGSTADWQNALNNMGSGLLSALSGMGVAFYTSLCGVACSIILTILRSIFNPESIRLELANEMELWLDHRTAPRLHTDRVKDDTELVKRMAGGLNNAADAMSTSLAESTEALLKTMDGFNATVESFNQGVRDFSEFDYNLRGTVERLDLAVRELSGAIRRVTRGPERSDKQ